MEQIRSLSQLLEYAKKIGAEKGPKKLSVAMAEDAGLLSAIEEARVAGIAEAILVGRKEKIEVAAKEAGVDLANYEVVDEPRGESAMAMTAVEKVSSGQAHIYMKGQLHTNHFLRGMLNKEVGLRKGKNTISHCYFHSVEGYDRVFFVADAAFNMYPDLPAKANILQNTVNFARAFGVEEPKVAVLAAVEVVNPDMPCTIDASALTQMNRRGQIKNCVVDGPFALDNAVSEESAKTKGLVSPVAGKADVLLVPDIEAGNMMVKALVYFSKNETAGLILGAAAPVILTSRADSPRAKLLSIAAAVLLSSFEEK
ncbi:MAG: bifunctional enoyl-CoA hydratase/phosphate acetyltransferase [Aminobacterium sp.]|jgi:phosphate butyryltransferase|nr:MULTISPECIES: bifunctional enoyl-CoA hydratase/phosphate acetyltransferase [unclassified Aminobacterium]MDD2206712.1 bifunctional enoyl-CoA hydratase/phosphate acetyltransferase [Aminobacterium sp.]MDD3425292.1 bifunctional enoyl-CoA hydratase/phosphate acetyltransferase [Aminobacterium sp.]MDD3706869.1 bifunctional enoyl-CoA hydratase/phosphate acetyltransferase [Aminobacterium sp.]MDD4228874.1 bifunctional enoyl-CoA hydratase/phosphate acetyltransferase [Aminobacterium sp.]MDD4551071.1 bi